MSNGLEDIIPEQKVSPNVEEILIDADGVWYYGEKPLERLNLIRLFYTVLQKEGDDFWIVTPAERVPVRVIDAPYSVVSVQKNGDRIECLLNDESLICLTKSCLPSIAKNDALYITVRDSLNARFQRSAFLHIAEWIYEQNGSYFLDSCGEKIQIQTSPALTN